MKTDTYTKVVLTVIAGCMLIMVGRTLESPAPALAQSAQKPSPAHVIIDGVSPAMLRGIPVAVEEVSPIAWRPVVETLKESANSAGTGRPSSHVILDGLDPGLASQGLPVRSQDPNPGQPQHVIVDSAYPSVRWAYEQTTCRLYEINRMAAEGWELVQLQVTPDAAKGNWEVNFDKSCVGVFKRPLQR